MDGVMHWHSKTDQFSYVFLLMNTWIGGSTQARSDQLDGDCR